MTKQRRRRGELGRRAMTKLLQYVLANTLPTCYTGVDDWLYDFYPDLSWTDYRPDINALLNHERFPEVAAWFTKRYAFDMRAELEAALAQHATDGVSITVPRTTDDMEDSA